ncbi:phosphatase PAP2 family protein [bacterium]|nr:phosphatase PAP2 family protein [bacterium]
MRELIKRYRPLDYAFSLYHIIIIMLLLIFGFGKVHNIWFYLGRNLVFLLSANLLVRFFTPERKNIFLKFLRNFYPLLFFAANYKELGEFAFMIVPELQDHLIVNFELMIFGTHPTWWLEEHLNYRWLAEFLNFGYMSYYAMLPVLALILFYWKKDRYAFGHLIFTVAACYYIHFLCFVLFPVDGPWRYAPILSHFSDPVNGYILVPIQNKIMAAGAMVHSGCFPSSHIAVALVVTLNAWRFFKKLLLPYLTILFLMSLATFYLRYHYISDTVAGLLFGALLYRVFGKVYEKWMKKRNSQ